MRFTYILIAIVLCGPALGEDLNRCFYDHVRDAIELNRERRELYSLETDGKSERISRYLIIWEKLILGKSKKYDRRAQGFQKLGIPFMCEDFIDMSETPTYTNRTTEIPEPYLKTAEPRSRQIKKTLRSKLKQGYLPLKKQLKIELKQLDSNKSYDCLLRHLIESLLRTADLAPRYLSKVEGKQKEKLDRLIYRYLRLQIFGVGQAIFIDKKARSLQAEGVPILCNDVPPVHLSDWK